MKYTCTHTQIHFYTLYMKVYSHTNIPYVYTYVSSHTSALTRMPMHAYRHTYTHGFTHKHAHTHMDMSNSGEQLHGSVGRETSHLLATKGCLCPRLARNIKHKR